MSSNFKSEIMKRLSEGFDFQYLDETEHILQDKLSNFVKNCLTTTLFLSGASGSGKTYVLNKALNSVDFGDCWCHTIDCRLFSDDKSACKEFLRQMNSPNSSDVLDVLRESGSGILIFDHFDSIKIIKRQFFLYTLFDSIHSQSISLCLILVTSSHEPLTNLEKRVKSRCSPECISFPSVENFKNETFISLFKSPDYPKQWNASVDKTLKRPELFQKIIGLSPSLKTIMNFARMIMFEVKDSEKITEINVENAAKNILYVISPKRFLNGLSHLELIVVFMGVFMISQKRCLEFTNESLFKELQTQLVSCKLLKLMTTERFNIIWDKMISMKLFVYTVKDKSKTTTSLFEEDISDFVSNLPTEVQVWAKSWK